MKNITNSKWKVSQIALIAWFSMVVVNSIMIEPNLYFIFGTLGAALVVVLINAIVVRKSKTDKHNPSAR